MIFHPGRLLDSGTAHTVSILPSLRDDRGRALLVDPVEMTFETSTYYEWNITPTFGIGSDIQLVDAGGSRKIQFGAPDRAKIQFALYGITSAQFVELYAGRYGNNSLRITTDLMPVPAPGKAPEASWEYTDPGTEDHAVVETVIPAEIKPGLYILNLTYDGRLYDQLFPFFPATPWR
jgi:hypothetical protein